MVKINRERLDDKVVDFDLLCSVSWKTMGPLLTLGKVVKCRPEKRSLPVGPKGRMKSVDVLILSVEGRCRKLRQSGWSVTLLCLNGIEKAANDIIEGIKRASDPRCVCGECQLARGLYDSPNFNS